MEEKLSKNKRSLQRRLHTPLPLTYKWFHWGIMLILAGIFFIFNFGLWVVFTLGGRTEYFHCMSGYRIPNNYSPSVIRFIYFVDGHMIKSMLIPAIVMLVCGIVMLFLRKRSYKTYVENEVNKNKVTF